MPQKSIASLSAALGALSSLNSTTASITAPSMQVYHECSYSIYCKYFALTGKSTPWEQIPLHTVKSFNYPTKEYNATLWCAREPSDDSYSWMTLALEDSDSVDYYFGNYGQTTLPLQDGFSIGPVEQNSTSCQNIKCEGKGCAGAQSCRQDSTIRWSICANHDNSTVSPKLAPPRTIRFVA